MKKIYLLLTVLVPTAALAQPTLTQANNLMVGDFIESGSMYTSLAPNVQQGNTGPSQTWNFTTTTFDVMDTIIGVAVPPQYSSTFPTSNIAIDNGAISQDYSICTAGSNGFYFDGGAYVDPTFGPLTYAYSDPIANMKWPMTYNSSFVDTGYSDWIFPSSGPYDSTRQIVTMVMTVDADAWGTLTLSWGTETVLRVKREINFTVLVAQHDTINGWGPFTNYTAQGLNYEYWSANYNWFLASLNCDPATDTVVSYQIATVITEGVTEQIPVQAFSLYPNPAHSFVVIVGELNSEWEITDGSGRMVQRGIMRSDVVEISVENFAHGIYTMSVTDEYGVRSTRKFVVQ